MLNMYVRTPKKKYLADATVHADSFVTGNFTTSSPTTNSFSIQCSFTGELSIIYRAIMVFVVVLFDTIRI